MMALHKFRTNYDPPPVPNWQGMAWSAVSDNYEPEDPQGFGATELEAIADLLDQMMARAS